MQDHFLSGICIGRLNIFVDSVNIKRVLTCLVQLTSHILVTCFSKSQLYHISSDRKSFFLSSFHFKATIMFFQSKFASKTHEKILGSTLSLAKALPCSTLDWAPERKKGGGGAGAIHHSPPL